MPEKTENAAVAVRSADGLIRTGNEADCFIALPTGRMVASDSPEFEQILRKNLPPEIAPDVLMQWHGIASGTTRLQWIVSLLLLGVTIFFLYFFFPKTRHEEPVPQSEMEIVDFSRKLRSNSPYRGDYEQAYSAYKQGNYNESAQILKDDVDKIIQTSDREANPVLFLYFDSLLKLKNIDNGDSAAAAQLRVIREYDRDNPAWAQFAFELDPRIRRMRNYAEVRTLLRNPAYSNSLRTHLYEADYALKQLRILRTLVSPAKKYSKKQLLQYQENFDLYEVQLLLSRWLLLGTAAGKATLPDNSDDPGVQDREKALRLALKHESASCEDFWLARRFIAEILCGEDSLFNHIYWNGRYLKTKELLAREIEICNQRLNRKEMP